MQQKISRLNVTLDTLNYKVSVDGDRVYLFNSVNKLAGSMSHEDFQIWAIELTAERAITEYIMSQVSISRAIASDADLKTVMIANHKSRTNA